ncbi:MAG: rhomboid family intramembrane serine protease [Candidatus Krumholzibacteriota bacterium]|nr:rhomboid family intramembrane serine protease [Candidatus Krumholzibacteriota bacterium]
MEQAVETFTILLMVANGIFSWKGFTDRRFYENHVFHVGSILQRHDYKRLVTSAFLHANIGHLVFNMLALYSFSIGVGRVFGFIDFMLVYFGSLLVGNILALFIHRYHPGYRAVGASGGVSGVIFSSILIFPHGSIGFLFLPFAIPSWLFGVAFILISIYGIRSRLGNIGHEAHLGGALTGILLSIVLKPHLLRIHPWLIAALLVPTLVFLLVLIYRPEWLRVGSRY